MSRHRQSKRDFDRQTAKRSAGNAVVALLAIITAAVCFVVMIRRHGRQNKTALQPSASAPLPAASTSAGPASSVGPHEFEQQRERLDRRLHTEIPHFRDLLKGQFRVARLEVAEVSRPEAKAVLDAEMEEIARVLLALDRYESDCQVLAIKMESAGRQFERFKLGQNYLGTDFEKFQSEIAAYTEEAAIKLSSSLDKSLGPGAIQDSMIQEKITELQAAKRPLLPVEDASAR